MKTPGDNAYGGGGVSGQGESASSEVTATNMLPSSTCWTVNIPLLVGAGASKANPNGSMSLSILASGTSLSAFRGGFGGELRCAVAFVVGLDFLRECTPLF